jgi:hypothetical protein
MTLHSQQDASTVDICRFVQYQLLRYVQYTTVVTVSQQSTMTADVGHTSGSNGHSLGRNNLLSRFKRGHGVYTSNWLPLANYIDKEYVEFAVCRSIWKSTFEKQQHLRSVSGDRGHRGVDYIADICRCLSVVQNSQNGAVMRRLEREQTFEQRMFKL